MAVWLCCFFRLPRFNPNVNRVIIFSQKGMWVDGQLAQSGRGIALDKPPAPVCLLVAQTSPRS